MGNMLDTFKQPSQENFHQLRVGLKRIQFIGKVLKRYGLGSKKDFRCYGKIFILAGNIRQYHVYSYLLKKHGSPGTGKKDVDHFLRAEQKLLKKWGKKVPEFLKETAKSFPVIIKNLRGWNLTTSAFANDLKRRVDKRIKPDMPEKRLHKSRKILKAILYSSEISPELNKRLSRWYDLEAVLKLEDAIGDWHDLELLLHDGGIRKYFQNKKFRTHLAEKKGKERKKIRDSMPAIFRQP